MDSTSWGLVGLIVLLLIGGFFSTARAALSNLRRQPIREQAERGDRRAARLLEVAENSAQVLNTFRLATLIVYFLIAALATTLLLPPLATRLGAALPFLKPVSYLISYAVAIPLLALLAFLLTESLPEALAQRDPAVWAMALLTPAQITIALFRPLVALVTNLRRGIAPMPSGSDGTALLTEAEIMTLIDAGEEEGAIEEEEKEMIYSIFQLDETLVREIMVPRIDIVALEMNTPLEEARRVIIEAGHSRIPVYENSLDNIKGLLYAKDLLRIWHEDWTSFDMAALLRPALFAPESKRVSDLLRELQSAKVHMAIVVDEYGGTAGLVTIEDIVEEIVGEIFDEYDEAEEALYEVLGPDEYVFDARINLDDFNHLLDVNLSDEMGDTLGGFIYGQLGKIPQAGEVVETPHLHMEVLTVLDRRIRKVRVKKIAADDLPPLSKEHNGNSHARNGNTH
mgnify:CR=1 FL=1